ncbi:MAG: efflux RND transporter permease subunit [Phycisphaeraceae bacterium]|nr:efflux RND transporter permease subunit [Phycisphaeraceae bacterium]
MDLIRWAISRPVTVAVGVILVVMFGLIGLGAIPIQLTPTVDRPVVTVTTNWPGRSPQEIIDNITREQEKRLKNVSNLKSMRSVSQEGLATITLEFYIGSDISRALQEVSDSLRQVPQYPSEVDEPVIKAADGASENAIAWIIIDIDPEHVERLSWFDISTLYDSLDKEVKPFLERIDGVAEVNIYGGREREVRVLADPMRLAQRRISPIDLIESLRAENRNVSAGTIEEGKRDYRVRVVGQFVTEEDVLNTIVAYREDPRDIATGRSGVLKPVYVKDVAEVEFGHQKERGFVRAFGQPCLAMNVIRQSNANVVTVMSAVRERLDVVRTDILPKLGGEAGPHLRIRQVYDETTYIDSAINLVTTNLLFGGLLAACVLLFFLRSVVATGIIAMAIPISVIGTFLVMVAFGRTINVISLAGLAFAVGMVVDNAVVVLENIYRRLGMGDSVRSAAYWGGKEVWAAVLASTLTTVAVFIPVLTIQEEAGQLFRDISLAIAAAVTLSLIVSITVVPAAASIVLTKPKDPNQRSRVGRAFATLFGLTGILSAFARRFGDLLLWLMTGWRAWSLRPLMIFALAALAVFGSLRLMPPLDYLPTGNRNLVFGGLLIPPGYSVEQMRNIARRVETQIKPYSDADITKPETVRALQPIARFEDRDNPFQPVPVENFFIGAFNGGMFVGATSQDEETVIPIGSLLTNAMNTIPDAFGGARQTSIFGRGPAGGGGNSVDVEIAGPNLSQVISVAGQIYAMAGTRYGYGFSVTPDPANFNLSQPEWTVRLNQRGREMGLTSRDVGTAVRGLFDGAFVDDFRLADDTVDLVVLPTGGRLEYKERLAAVPIATGLMGPDGLRIVPLDSVVDVVESQSPQSIQRIEELPAVIVRIVPPKGQTVEQVMQTVRDEFIAPLEASGVIDNTMRIRLEGTAASLDEVRASLFGQRQGGQDLAGWQRGLTWLSRLMTLAAIAAAAVCALKAFGVLRRRVGFAASPYAYGAIGLALLGAAFGGMLFEVALSPQLLTARFIWALLVTYLLMCALFESFLYPVVIMLSVPLAVVGGFAGLAIVHAVTLADPTKAPQQLDVVTMLGFVVLIGTVVNNAILIVEQSLNFENPARFGSDAEPKPLFLAVRESVVSRMRPIFMTTCTTLGGMLPLVVAPGAGSEMYRGMGAVILGGLAFSTVFTLLLVPLVFSVVVQMQQGALIFIGRERSRAILPSDRVVKRHDDLTAIAARSSASQIPPIRTGAEPGHPNGVAARVPTTRDNASPNATASTAPPLHTSPDQPKSPDGTVETQS